MSLFCFRAGKLPSPCMLKVNTAGSSWKIKASPSPCTAQSEIHEGAADGSLHIEACSCSPGSSLPVLWDRCMRDGHATKTVKELTSSLGR